MSTEILEGIVIKTEDFEDYAQLLTIFSKNQGKFFLYAPGIRKESSKNKYSVQLLSKSEFEIFKSRLVDKTSKLKTGKLIHSFSAISKDFLSYLYAQAICDIIDLLTPYQLPDIETYQILEITLEAIEQDNEKFKKYILALYYLITLGGNKMMLDKCYR